MTVKRDLKRRVRDRQARTGERYTTALEQVLTERPAAPGTSPDAGNPAPSRRHTPVPVVELVDVSEVAAAVGLKGRVVMYPDLVERVDPRVALSRLRQLLVAAAHDERTSLFQTVLMKGERPAPVSTTTVETAEVMAMIGMMYGERFARRSTDPDASLPSQRFFERAQGGLSGPSDSGFFLSVTVEGRRELEHVVCMLWGLVPVTLPIVRDPFVVLRSARSLLDDAAALPKGAGPEGRR
jgi:hypothetical protein